ncbi:PREDICTED: HVA22-like protein i-like [Fragaria vesca subsp. vesca]|uniref:putative HVA22-like protein g n=1 Tax=Fragaria vesca subsp. vesca TaxID=101020 RepID=UPI0002C3445E|nr:PREDICTED: putative HVA22-like protein g [Fragaria vesca subsp. vesca]
MIGSFLTRGLVMILGYAYPAYECYKTVEKNKPEIEQLRFWCQYWILVAVLTVCERVGDTFVSWVPMYSEAKLLFIIYLWFPKTKGTTYVYDSFFRPYLAKHENDIDRNLLELRTRAGDIAIVYWQRAASYGQTRVFDILQYVAAQSTPTPRPRPAQPQPGVRGRQPPAARQPAPAPNRQPAATPQSQPEEPPSPTSSTTSSKDQREILEALAPLPKPKAAPQAAGSNTQKTPAPPESSSQSKPAEEVEAMQVDAVTSTAATESTIPPPKDTLMEGTIRQTRASLRKTRSTVAGSSR